MVPKAFITSQEKEIFYPETDGEPMAETDMHRDQMINLITTLKDFFRDEPEIYVSGNLLIYFREGDPSACVAPDIFVVKGVRNEKRRIFKVWEEEKGPDLVIELTSRSTAYEDSTFKLMLYAQELKAKEYFLFDPLEEYLTPQLQGYRLLEGDYTPIQDKHGRLRSQVLGLDFGIENGELRLYNEKTGERLLTPQEQGKKLRMEIEARKKAEIELARLRGER